MACYSAIQQLAFNPAGTPIRHLGMAGLLALSSIAMAPQALAANAGRTTAVIQDARGTPPGQTMRILQPKLDVFQNERIQTDDRGVTQILFVDGTNLTVGPNSDLTIDRFVYNPETSVGEIVAKVGRGVLRFVGGQISKRGKVSISTPTAVIGVRGGIGLIEHNDNSGTRAVFLFGDGMTATGLGPDGKATQTKNITRPGYSISVSNVGRVADAVRIEQNQLSSMLSSLEAKKGSARKTAKAISESAAVYSEDAENGETVEQEISGRPIPEAIKDVRRIGKVSKWCHLRRSGFTARATPT